jgi:hypothetical protein
MIINEAVFSVFPTCVYMLSDFFNIQYASRFGPFMTMGHALDVLITTLMFYRTWLPKTNHVGHIRFVMKMTINSSVTEDPANSGNASRKY